MRQKFNNGDIVFLITDKEQSERMIVGVFIEPNGISYKIACGATITWHSEIEISANINIVSKLK